VLDDDDENGLHGTAVAQVFAFILQALRAEPPSLSWHDTAAGLHTWAVEYDDVLRNIPETVRKGKEARASPYKPQRWRGFKRSPIQTRSRCKRFDSNAKQRDDSGDDEEGTPPSPTPTRSVLSGGRALTKSSADSAGIQAQENRLSSQGKQINIKDRQFPKDRGYDAHVVPLHLSGSTGSLFKVRVSSHGYTLVAKGVETLDLARLRHENEVTAGRGIVVVDFERADVSRRLSVCSVNTTQQEPAVNVARKV
ncbi:hypothetical protein CORC01_14409, partial [Colletotrichum orchidophilum]